MKKGHSSEKFVFITVGLVLLFVVLGFFIVTTNNIEMKAKQNEKQEKEDLSPVAICSQECMYSNNTEIDVSDEMYNAFRNGKVSVFYEPYLEKLQTYAYEDMDKSKARRCCVVFKNG